MLSGLLFTALVMGLAGGPHCVAMCGAATAGIGCTPRRLWCFQAGRMAGYAALGALVASSVQVLEWSAAQTALLKPFWAMFHVAVISFGASLVWLGRQPRWVEQGAHHVWQTVRRRTLRLDERRWPAAAGALWALLPCGLLYSALVVAGLASGAWEGGAVMAAFAAGSAVSLHFGPALWRRWRASVGAGAGSWAVRLAGAALAGASIWAVAHGLWFQHGAAVC